MAGILGRISTIFKAKITASLDAAENPNETLDLSYEQQVEQLQKVRRGVADVEAAIRQDAGHHGDVGIVGIGRDQDGARRAVQIDVVGPGHDVGGVAGFEFAGQQVDRAERTYRTVGGGVMTAVDVGGPAGKSAAAQLVVLESVEIGVQPSRGLAFSQVNEGFHE